MSNEFSKVGMNASFVDDRDTRFAELIKNPLFWVAVAFTKAKGEDHFTIDLCQRLAVEGSAIFELRYRRNFAIKRIVEYGKDSGKVWFMGWIKIVLLALEQAREAWDKGKIPGSPETYTQALQVILRKVFDRKELTQKERSIIIANASTRLTLHQSCHPIQNKIIDDEFKDMTSKQRSKRILEIMSEVMRP